MKLRIVALALFTVKLAYASGVVAVTDKRVPQFRQAEAAAREVIHDLQVVDVADGDAAAQLQKIDPAVALAIGPKALQTAKEALPQTPIVYCMVLGAQVSPSRMVTGVALEVPPYAQFSLLKSLAPGAKRIGVIYDPRASGGYVDEAARAAAQLGFTLAKKAVSDPKEVRSALSSLEEDIDVLWLVPDPRLSTSEMFRFLLVATLDRKIALLGFLDSFTQQGALASVAPDFRDIGLRAARLASGIAGRPPAERIPVPAATTSPGSLTINVKTAHQLGVDVPEWMLSRAKQVYR